MYVRTHLLRCKSDDELYELSKEIAVDSKENISENELALICSIKIDPGQIERDIEKNKLDLSIRSLAKID